MYAHTDEEIEARGIVDVSEIAGIPGPVFTTAWNPLNRSLLPAIVELALAQEHRFSEGAKALEAILPE